MHELSQTRDLAAFVAVVEDGGFSYAAQRLNISASTLSRTIAKLEQDLGFKLLRRTTRSLDLTPEGAEVLKIARDVIGHTARLYDVGAGSRSPKGPLRVNASVPFMLHVLIPALPDFQTRYPDIEISLTMTDNVVDLIGSQADVAIRFGKLENSELLFRHLGRTAWRLVASHAYVETHGTPETTDALGQLKQVRFLSMRHLNDLCFKGQSAPVTLATAIEADNGEAIHQAVLNGLGVARLSDYLIHEDLAVGRLIELLPGQLDVPPLDISAVYTEPISGSRRLEAFLDFMQEQLRDA